MEPHLTPLWTRDLTAEKQRTLRKTYKKPGFYQHTT